MEKEKTFGYIDKNIVWDDFINKKYVTVNTNNGSVTSGLPRRIDDEFIVFNPVKISYYNKKIGLVSEVSDTEIGKVKLSTITNITSTTKKSLEAECYLQNIENRIRYDRAKKESFRV